jgi:hypothetical protein
MRHAQPTTKVLQQLGLDGSTIIGSAYSSFIPSGRNSAGHYLKSSTIFNKFSFSTGQTVDQFPNCSNTYPLPASV